MKKIASFILILALAAAMTGCAGKDSGNGPAKAPEGSPKEEIPADAIILKEGNVVLETQRLSWDAKDDYYVAGFTADKDAVYYILTDYKQNQSEHTEYAFFRLDRESGEAEQIFDLYENGTPLHVNSLLLFGDDLVFVASRSGGSGICLYCMAENTIEMLVELPEGLNAPALAQDSRYICWIQPEEGRTLLQGYDIQTREQFTLTEAVDARFEPASLYLNDGVCSVLESVSGETLIVSYDLAQRTRISSGSCEKSHDIRKLQGNPELLIYSNGLGKDALIYSGNHDFGGFAPLYKASGDHISSFSSHLWKDKLLVNSQNPAELLLIYPYDGLFSSLKLENPLFNAVLSPYGTFCAADNASKEFVCLDLE